MLIAKGAEAELKKEGDTLVKERIKKSYRLPEIDEKLRKRRTSLEARLLREARRSGVLVPQVLEEDKTALVLEFIEGQKVKDVLDKENCKPIAEKIGESIARLHIYDIIHGDLTTSNIIVAETGSRDEFHPGSKKEESQPFFLWFIDFGLGFVSKRLEDKAVDLHLLHEVLKSTHFALMEDAWTTILEAYRTHYHDGSKVIKALSNVEKRGRYKER